MSKFTRSIEIISNIFAGFSGALVLVMMALIMVEVFMRYVLNRAPGVADEFSAYMYIALTFLGLAYTWKEKGHVRIGMITDKLSKQKAAWLRLVILFLALSYIVVASQACWQFVVNSAARGLRSQTWLRVPIQWPELPIALGFSLLALQLVVEIIKTVNEIKVTGRSAG